MPIRHPRPPKAFFCKEIGFEGAGSCWPLTWRGDGCAGVCLVAQYTIMADWQHLRFIPRCAALGVSIGIAAFSYFAVTKKLDVEDIW